MSQKDTQRSIVNAQLSPSEGDWVYLSNHQTHGRIIERMSLWGHEMFRVWLPISNTVIRLQASEVSTQCSMLTSHHVTYIAAAARVADAMNQDLFLAPIESSVIPLPHQIRALSRALSNDRVRYLLADEVGLGKTIEAGLIMRELKIRGLVKRTLVIAPKGLVSQWIAEMAMHFGEQFHPILSEDYKSLKRISAIYRIEDRGLGTEYWERTALRSAIANPFQAFDQVVVSIDSVKPPSNAGSTALDRFEDLISAGWDLIIVDEAHRLGGSTEQVARYKLGKGLAEAAPYLLLLSATPHQGKTDAFHRLISLIDAKAFPDVGSVTKERVQPYVIRTEKRHAIDAQGMPLFKPRRTQLAPVSWEDRHQDQRLLYEAVTEYVREGYKQAVREKRSYIGFLMILMQRLVVSSTRAIRTTLERRLEAIETPPEQLTLFPEFSDEDWADLDGQEQIDTLLNTRFMALKNERTEVRLLLEAAMRNENKGSDAKAEALMDWIYRLQAEEHDPNLKVLVFTEFVPTQEMLYEFLTKRGFEVVCLNGSMDMEERKRVQDAFANDARILISTDAGGEGLNLQFCHVVINYDIPWNPMRLEQRIGRVDRIGQTYTVRAINFVFEDSVEHRVLEVLEDKLAVIFEEFGIDKTGDVLDSAQAERIFDELYIDAILNPEKVNTKINEVLNSIKEQAQVSRQSASVLGSAEELDPREAQQLLAHPLPAWIETMTASWLRSKANEAALREAQYESNKPGAEIIGKMRSATIWRLTWPDGTVQEGSFTNHASLGPQYSKLGLEDPRVRRLAMRIPSFVSGQPVPVITLPDLAPEIQGFWSLWEICTQIGSSVSTQSSSQRRQRRLLPLFLADDGRMFVPTARHIWDQLLVKKLTILRYLDIETSMQAFEQLRQVAERQGKMIYDELVAGHREHLVQEREKGEYAFTARRRAIERIGLPQVRNHRLSLLKQEEEHFREQLERRAQILPEMASLIIMRVEAER